MNSKKIGKFLISPFAVVMVMMITLSFCFTLKVHAAASFNTNLIQDGDGEVGDDGDSLSIHGWSYSESDSWFQYKAIKDSSPHSGNNFLGFYNPSYNSFLTKSCYQDIDVSSLSTVIDIGNAVVNLDCYLQVVANLGSGKLNLQTFDSYDNQVGSTYQLSCSKNLGWKSGNINKAIPQNTRKIRITLTGNGMYAGFAAFDDLSLKIFNVTTIPSAATKVSAVSGNEQASISFTAPASDGGSAIKEYTVTSSPGSLTGTGATSPITVTGLTNGTSYTFAVTATNVCGIGASSVASNVVTPATMPNAPTITSVTGGNGQASISFTAPASDGGSAITGYTVTSSPGGLTGTGTTSPIMVTGLTNGTEYTFKVTATNAVGAGSASSPSSSVTPATMPNAPTTTDVTGGNGQASISFTAPASNGGSAIKGYTVTSSPGNLTGTGTTSPIIVTGLTNGTAYTFTVTATNAVGTGVASSASSNVTPATTPNAPTTTDVTGGNGQASISFTAPASNGGSAITGYTVTSSPGGLTGTGTTSPIMVTGLTNGTEYTFKVTATNAVGTGSASSPSSSVTPGTTPNAPTITGVAGGNGQASISFTAPASDGGSAITGYTVTSSPGNLTGTGTTSPIMVTGLTNGTEYTFTVTATNAVGTGAASLESSIVTPLEAPAVASISSSQTITIGQNASFSVVATGTSPLSYQWKKGSIVLTDLGSISGATSSALSIINAQAGDAGSYTVEISNAAGSVTSSEITLTVNAAPTYTIEVSQKGIDIFPSQTAGYSIVTPQSITVTKTGTGDIQNLAVTLTGANASSFTLGTLSTTTLNITTTSAAFTLRPNNGLVAGNYTATVTVMADSSVSQSFDVNFTVNPVIASTACEVTTWTTTTSGGITVTGTTATKSVGNGISSIVVDLTVSANASWKLYSDASCTTEITNKTMNLSVGANTAYVKVTAEDGSTTKVYTLIITRVAASTPIPTPIPNPTPTPITKSTACDVTAWTTTSGSITVTGTTAIKSVENGITSVVVDVTVSANASWKLYSDASCTTEITNKTMNLSVGANTAYVKVTAEDGSTAKVYTLTVTRAAATGSQSTTGSSESGSESGSGPSSGSGAGAGAGSNLNGSSPNTVIGDVTTGKTIDGVSRVAGQDRIDTSIKLAKVTYPGKLSNVIFTTSENFADALAGSVLAYKLGSPILLVGSSDSDQQKVLDYINANMDKTGMVYILGGNGVVSKEFEDKVTGSGFLNITRLGGVDRYETSVKIAESLKVDSATPVIIASGESYPDALSISSIAAVNGYPILLVKKDEIADTVKQELGTIAPQKVFIIGLQGAVGTVVENQIPNIVGKNENIVSRIGGQDRFETSLATANNFKFDGNNVCIATGNDFPDALAGSLYAAKHNSPIILVDKVLTDSVAKYITEKKTTGVMIFGGESAVNQDIQQQLAKILNK